VRMPDAPPNLLYYADKLDILGSTAFDSQAQARRELAEGVDHRVGFADRHPNAKLPRRSRCDA